MAKAIFDTCTRSRRARRTALVAVCAGLIVLVAAPLASARVRRDFYGIVGGTPLTTSDFNRMGKARVGSLRTGIGWPTVQPQHRGPFSWATTDAVVAQAARHHISILPILAGTPSYEANGCSSQTCLRHIRVGTKSQRRDWKAFVKAAAQRYGHHGAFWRANPSLPYKPISRWQIWNEENNPSQHNSAKHYATLLALSDRAVHAADRNGQIMLGGMPGTTHGAKSSSAWRYLSAIYRHHGGKHFDAVALHPYSTSVKGIRVQVKRIRHVLRRHHDGNRRTFITEIGWGSSRKHHAGTGARGAAFNVGPRQQKRKLAGSFGLATRHRSSWKIGGIYWYQWKDPSNPPPGLCAFCYSSGLYKANGTKAKPALAAYKRFTRKTR